MLEHPYCKWAKRPVGIEGSGELRLLVACIQHNLCLVIVPHLTTNPTSIMRHLHHVKFRR